MQNIAEFRIIGRVGKISEHDKVTKVNVAANYNRQENGEWVTDTHWNEVTLFGKLIERGGKAQKGDLVHEPPPEEKPSRFKIFRGGTVEPRVSTAEIPPGHTRRETEGVFLLRDEAEGLSNSQQGLNTKFWLPDFLRQSAYNRRAVFVPVKLGIAGERYFEVLSGLTERDRVITGPFSSVRELPDGGRVELTDAVLTTTTAP